MIYTNYFEQLNSPIRKIGSKVELLSSTTTYTHNDSIKEISIERTAEDGKLFGFGIVQKATVKLVDTERLISLAKGNQFKIYFNVEESEYNTAFPIFNIEEVNRDEKTNEITITAFDKLNTISAHTVAELELEAPYTINDVAIACCNFIGVSVVKIGLPEEDISFNTLYENGANFDGKETLREVLNAIAEATQTIYYLDYNNNLVFKRLSNSTPDLFIDKTQYMELSSKPDINLVGITTATELGDNLTATTGIDGTIQIVRDNPFFELREDLTTLLDNAVAAIDGICANPMECIWRGNFLVEIGDRIAFDNKDSSQWVTCYLLNDTLSYTGGLSQKSKWEYKIEESATVENSTNLGEAIKQTFARVDKANKQIDLVASETSANSEAVSALQLNTESIVATVSSIETTTQEAIEGANEEIATLKKSVETQITSEDVTLAIKQELDNGVEKVTTAKGFVFDNDGLTIEVVDADGNRTSETSTTISENGMQVFNNSDEAVLTANNDGVNAVNLHATTYLIIGNNSRFEDYGTNRTGCFWIGG